MGMLNGIQISKVPEIQGPLQQDASEAPASARPTLWETKEICFLINYFYLCICIYYEYIRGHCFRVAKGLKVQTYKVARRLEARLTKLKLLENQTKSLHNTKYI